MSVCATYRSCKAKCGRRPGPPSATSVDLAQHSMPPRPAGKMNQRLFDPAGGAQEASIAVISGRGFDRPIDHRRSAHDRVTVDKAPVAAIPTVISVIAHREITICGNDELALLDVGHEFEGPFRTQSGVKVVAIGWREIIAEGIAPRRVMNHIGLPKPLAVNINLLINDADVVARQTDDAFYVVRMIVKRELEDDDIAMSNRPVRKQPFIPRATALEQKFVHE